MKKTRSRRTRFVPRVVFKTTFAGVVPVCVAAAAATDCGSTSSPSISVAAIGFDSGADSDAPFWSVAAIGFDSGDAAALRPDAADAADERDAPIFSVANIGFDSGDADAAARNRDGDTG
jgi:hypothetical protein